MSISLAPLSPEDSALAFNWRNNPAIFKWCRQNDFLNLPNHEKWFRSQFEDKSVKFYAIKLTEKRIFEDGSVFNNLISTIGVAGLTSIDLINQRAEFSLYIGPENHGKGYGKEALKALVRHGFNILPLNIIWGETYEGNPAYKMFEDVGFKKEGTRREFYCREGKFVDAHLYSIKRGELKDD